MNQLRILSMILQTSSPTIHDPSTRLTCASYVGMILTMVMIIHHDSRLSMSKNRVIIKTLVILIIHIIHQVFFAVQTVANLGTYLSQHFNSFCYDDNDDDEEFSIPVSEIYKSSLTEITTSPPVLPTKDPEDSLNMGNKELSTIPEKESDEFINYSVEDLVPIPMTFSNHLFNSNYDFTSSDDESLSDEDVPEDNAKIYSNPLFEFDDEYISSDVITPLFDSNEDEYFASGDDIELLLHRDPSTLMTSIVSILEGFTD
nr:hypothetical protein [Tanacetum cinerariifolium]